MTVDVVRDVFVKDAYGGETATPGAVYSGLTATFNYYKKDSLSRFEGQGSGATIGPGVLTRTIGVVIFDPKPDNVTIRDNDRIVPNPAVAGVPAALGVIGVRAYEFSLQLDVEDVS